jgi:hypothetical protein
MFNYNFYTTDFMIETVQTFKKSLTDQIIKDPTLHKAAINYIDAQTNFAKMLGHNTVDIVKYSLDSLSKVYFPK